MLGKKKEKKEKEKRRNITVIEAASICKLIAITPEAFKEHFS